MSRVQTAVLVARALHELPVARRGVGSQGRAGQADRRAAGRRHGAEWWRASGPAQLSVAAAQRTTVVWAEALDNGDPEEQGAAPRQGDEPGVAVHRSADRGREDRIPLSPVPRGPTPARCCSPRTIAPGAGRGRGSSTSRAPRRARCGIAARKIRTTTPGTPQRHERASGSSTVLQAGDSIFLSGQGASPEGARPFVDRLNLGTLKSERLFQTTGRSYETVIGVLSDDGSRILTRYESRTEPPNVFVRDLKSQHAPPAHQLRGSRAAAPGRAEAARHLQARGRRRAVGDADHAAGMDAGQGPAADPALGVSA